MSDDIVDNLANIDKDVAEVCENKNSRIVIENFKEFDSTDGILNQQGVWKIKKKLFPKLKQPIPIANKNLNGKLVTNPLELKKLYLDTFKFRLRHRPLESGYENLLKSGKSI